MARCTVARLMAVMGLAGVLRGKKVRTTISRKAVAAGDRVNRQFVAERPDQLWVADFTYVSTWRASSMWRSSLMCLPDTSWGGGSHRPWKRHSCWMHWSRRYGPSTVRHGPSHDKGSQYVSLAYTQRLKEAGLLASTGSTGDSYDNAMAESINGLYKAEVIHRKSWKNRAEVELATLTWVDWYNNRRLLERLGHTPPAEAEKAYYASIGNDDLGSLSSQMKHSQETRGGSGRLIPPLKVQPNEVIVILAERQKITRSRVCLITQSKGWMFVCNHLSGIACNKTCRKDVNYPLVKGLG